MSSPLNILFIGATGYIGGAVLGHLTNHYRGNSNVHIKALVRTEAKAQLVIDWAKARNVDNLITTVLGSLDDEDIIVSEVSKADVTIDTAHSDHLPAANYFVKGLKLAIENRKPGQIKPLLIHTSGTGLLTDDSYGLKTTDKIYHDDKEDEINSLPDTAPHRDVDLVLLNFVKENSGKVGLAVVAPPTIWGLGSGPDSVQSIQIPLQINKAIPLRQAYNVGKGANVWTQINVIDLAEFYLLLLLASLESPGKHSGFFFVENGEFSWSEVGQAIQEGLIISGFTNEKSAKDTITEEEYFKVFGKGGFPYRNSNGGNSRARAVRAKEFGWKAKYSSHEQFLWDITQSVILQARFGKDNKRDKGHHG